MPTLQELWYTAPKQYVTTIGAAMVLCRKTIHVGRTTAIIQLIANPYIADRKVKTMANRTWCLSQHGKRHSVYLHKALQSSGTTEKCHSLQMGSETNPSKTGRVATHLAVGDSLVHADVDELTANQKIKTCALDLMHHHPARVCQQQAETLLLMFHQGVLRRRLKHNH